MIYQILTCGHGSVVVEQLVRVKAFDHDLLKKIAIKYRRMPVKFYNLKAGANPRKVRIFMAEKKIDIECVDVDMNAGENNTPSYLAKNPMGKMPVLELDDGTYLAESLAICRYLEGLVPDPPLFGDTDREKAEIEMWVHRVEHEIYKPISDVFFHLSDFWKGKREQFPDYGEYQRAYALMRFSWLDSELSTRNYIAGDTYTIADICAQSAFVLGKFTGTPIPKDFINLVAWYENVSRRPSARA